MSVTWIVEKSLFWANDQQDVVQAMRDQGHRVRFVDFVPFSHEIEPNHKIDSPTVVVGSCNLIREVAARGGNGWRPGIWYGRTFDADFWSQQLPTSIYLNGSIRLVTLGKLKEQLTTMSFVRPADGLKVFSGTVVSPDRIDEWLESVRLYGAVAESAVPDSTLCLVSKVREIYAEYRFFVANNKVVSGCMYKERGYPNHRPILDLKKEPSAVFAQLVTNYWQPAEAFVLDVAMTPEGLRVIEFNCFNSAGFYACPPEPIVQAIDAALA